MNDHFFSIFDPFKDRFQVLFFDKSDAIESDADLREKLGTDNTASVWQKHGNGIVIARAPTARTQQADGLATDAKNLWISIRAADCQQLVVYAPERHVAGVIHAGWKGLEAGVISAFFETMKNEWGISPRETYVGIGPSLCQKCAEFTDPVTELAGLDNRFFHGRHADLTGIADAQLDALGIPASQRERNPDCTKCRSDIYWSYRGGDKEKVLAGSTDVLACILL